MLMLAHSCLNDKSNMALSQASQVNAIAMPDTKNHQFIHLIRHTSIQRTPILRSLKRPGKKLLHSYIVEKNPP